MAELELKASFSPDTGLVAVEGQLTPQSFILSRDCHLIGGFAFYFWFSGPHQGEFVVTLGGYSPRFTPPAYYPQVPRLGLNWKVCQELTIKGELYFALTPKAVMAGGGMSAVWESGCIRAWFYVGADFLMVFTPLQYYLSAGVHLGASVRLNLLSDSCDYNSPPGCRVGDLGGQVPWQSPRVLWQSKNRPLYHLLHN